MAKQNKPAIRFKGFTDAWEQRKLGEILQERNTRTSDFESNPLYSLTIESGVTPKTDRYERSSLVTKTEDLFKTVKPNEFVTNPMNLRFGALGYNKNAFTVSVSGYYDVFSIDDDKCSGFWNAYFKTPTAMNIFDNAATGSLIEKRRVKYSTLQQLAFYMPNDLSEKAEIGKYMDTFDHLITLHQRKFDKLQVLKKAMLEKMFPKNGSSVPEIRFKGFTDAWEQRKLGDNIVEYTEVTTENNQYPPLTSSRKGIFLQTEYFAGNQIASDDNTGYNIVPYGYFTYRHMSDDEVFHFNINDIVEKGIVSTLYPVFTTDENLDSRYLQYQLNYGHEFAKFAILQKQGGSRTYMYLNKLRQLHLTMPNHVEEQKAISSFFMNLDHLITLHQRELEKLQNIKKSMLEKMFV